jgi:hypothetical protein
MHPLRAYPMHPLRAKDLCTPLDTKLEIPLRDYKENLSHSGGENTASLVGEQGTKASNPPTIPQEEAEAGGEVGDREQGVGQLPQDIPARPRGESTEVTFFQDRKNERNGVDTLIREFYVAIGQPKIAPGIIKRGREQIAELLKDYSLADVGAAITYVANGERDSSGRLLDQRNKPIGSIGYVSYIIAEAVEKAAAKAEALARLAREEAARQEEEAGRNREARALAKEWIRNKPAWMSKEQHDWFVEREAELPEKTQATEPAPVTVTPTPAPTVSDDSVGEGFAQAAA